MPADDVRKEITVERGVLGQQQMEIKHGLGRDQLVQPDRARRDMGPLAGAPGVIGIRAALPDLLKDHATSLDEDGECFRQAAAAPQVRRPRLIDHARPPSANSAPAPSTMAESALPGGPHDGSYLSG